MTEFFLHRHKLHTTPKFSKKVAERSGEIKRTVPYTTSYKAEEDCARLNNVHV